MTEVPAGGVGEEQTACAWKGQGSSTQDGPSELTLKGDRAVQRSSEVKR